MLHPVRHPHSLERFVNPSLAFSPVHPPVSQRQFDVLKHVQVADQVEALKDEADFAVADAGAVGVAQVGHGMAVQGVAPFRRRVQQSQNGKQGGFAAAGRAGDGQIVAAVDLQVNPGQGMSFHFIGEKYLLDAFEAEQRLRGRTHILTLLEFHFRRHDGPVMSHLIDERSSARLGSVENLFRARFPALNPKDTEPAIFVADIFTISLSVYECSR